MKNLFNSIRSFISAHKIASTIGIIVIAFIGWRIYVSKTSTTTVLYTIATVQKGTIISTVTGTGQVSASSQISLQSGASGNVIYVAPVTGKTVTAGTLIEETDPTSVKNALDSAKLAYAKLIEAANTNDVATSQAAVTKSYNDALSTVSAVFLSYPNIISGINSLLYSKTGYLGDQNMIGQSADVLTVRSQAGQSFDTANREYTTVLAEYGNITQNSSRASIVAFLSDTEHMVKDMSDALQNTQNTLTVLSTQSNYNSSGSATANANVNSWLSSINSSLSNVISAQNGITNVEAALTKLTQGPDSIDVQSQQLALQLKQQAYDNAFVTAPFDGVLAKTNANVGDTIGSGTTVGTFISNQDVAVITINEVDVANVKIGQKVTLTFDAINNLTITGTVAVIDQVGAVSSGVVTYGVKISFDTQDPRVLSGMSVNASIATQVDQDVLVVPSSAIKTSGSTSYVQVVPASTPVSTGTTGQALATPPINQPVTVSISDNTSTEIVSGVSLGDKIVTKTTGTPITTTTSAPSIFGAAGVRTGGGGGGGGGGRTLAP
jgi:HlyD family secretion protein